MKLDELFDQRLPMPRGYYLDPNGFLSNFHGSTITDALGIIKGVADPCEASVELKLFFDSHQGEWTGKKSVETAWTLFGVDGWDLLESAYLTIPVYGPVTAIAAAVDDWKDRWEVFSQEYKDEMANKQAEVALNAFKSSKGWTREDLESGLESLNNEISDTQAKIGTLKQAYFTEALRVEGVLKSEDSRESKYGLPEQLAERRLETFGEVFKLERKLGTLILQKKAILRYRAPIVMGTCEQDLKTPKIPVLQPCPGSATQLQLNEGTVRYSDDNPPDKNGLKIELGGNTVTHKNTEMVCEKHGDSCKVTVIKGNVSITNATRPEIVIGSGQQIDLVSGKITSFNVTTDNGGLVDGIPLRDLPLDDASGLPYGLYMPNFRNNTVPASWLWQDPGSDARVETPEPGTLKVTVPDGNEFWDARTQAPRLLHKVTGDFDLEGELLLKSNGTDHAVSEFLMYSPGSYLGYLAKQMNPDGLGAHYRVIGGGWQHIQGMNKLLLMNEKLADGPNAPDQPVMFRLTRHGDVWKSYWSLDEVRWILSTRQEIAAPDTVWVGWLFKRNAYDGLRSEPAITTLRDVSLETAPRGSMNDSDWDLVQGAGIVQADNATVHMELNGSSLGTLYAFKGDRLEGDFDAVVRFQAENWTFQPGESRSFGLSADSLDMKTLAFIGIQEKDNLPKRYMTDLGINERFGRYQWTDTSDFSGYLRILRQKGNFSTYYWYECQWVRLDKFGAGFSDPVYIRMWISNKDQARVNARLSMDFTVEQILTGEAVGKNWTPAYCSILQSVPLPAGLKVPDGMQARMFQSPFALGTIFFGPDGEAYAFSSQKGKQKLLAIDSNRTAKTSIESSLLAGINRKTGLLQGENVLVTVDYWPESGNTFSGLYELENDGTYRKWNLTGDYGGLADIIHSPAGGWYFSDFEKDNIWNLPAEGVAETPLITQGDVPPGITDLAYDETNGGLYALNVVGGWPFGGKFAVYRVTEDGKAVLLATINETSTLNGEMALSTSGSFGHALYVSDAAGGSVLKVDFDGTITPVVTGLVKPGSVEFSSEGDLLVVCNDGRDLFMIGSEGGGAESKA
jgi:hypothetical protein